MKVESLRVSEFRSLKSAAITDCGELNVLIGKNNSGKSNFLTSVKKFFDFFRPDGSVATIAPAISRITDWHDRNTENPVRISVTLQLASDEIVELKESITSEAPQMRNAIEGSNFGNLITVELSFYRNDKHRPPIGFVSLIRFGGGSGGSVIFSMGEDSAFEVGQMLAELNSFEYQREAYDRFRQRFDQELWMRIKERAVPISLSRTVIGPFADVMSPQELSTLVRSTDSYSEFDSILGEKSRAAQTALQSVSVREISHPVTTFSGDANSIPDYVSEFIRRMADLRVHYLSEQRRPIGQAEAERILKLKTSRGQGHVLQSLQSVVSGLLGVRIDAFSSDGHGRDGDDAAELDVDEFLVQVNGSGIREALRLILDREFERPSILLVEEPEVHLHPALETALMQYLKSVSSECQIFLTTHSTNFLDVGALKNVYLIRKNVGSEVQRLDIAEAEEAIPQELGLRLSSLFMFDRLVFVEGPSDESILRTFADTLGVSFSQASLGFVTTGGARNFTHYATAATLAFLGKRNVKTVFVLDRDERDSKDVDDLHKKVDGISELKILERRELENYLINSSAIARYIEKKSEGRSVPGAEEIERIIREVCAELLDRAIERKVLKRVCKPLIPDRRPVIDRDSTSFEVSLRRQLEVVAEAVSDLSQGLSEIITQETSRAQAEWDDRKIEIVPGDEVLDAVFSRYNLRFNKRTDSLRLAQSMRADEIPAEIMSLIKRLIS